MIQIKNLKINVGEKEILKGITLNFELGKNYLILGKNGSGKSSLTNFLMGNPNYLLNNGEVFIDRENLLDMEVEQRAKKGLFLSFQNVPEIPGINLREYLRIIYNEMLKEKFPSNIPLTPFIFKRFIKKYIDELEIDENFLDRDLNVGFSGGEKRKIEILQAQLLNPKYIILDEIDSGLDLDALKKVGSLIKSINNKDNSIIMITHQFQISEFINFDEVIILKDGKIKNIGGTEMITEIIKNGFE